MQLAGEGIKRKRALWSWISIFCVGAAQLAFAQANLQLYTDHLVNGFQDWSWGTRDLANTSPVHTGVNSISLSGTAWNVALSLHQTDFDVTSYSALVFWANGGSTGGQVLQAAVDFGTSSGVPVALTALPSNSWQQYIVPLTSLGVANETNVNRITILLTSSGAEGTFYIDDVQLTAKPAPALTHINVNSSNVLRSVDSRWFGFNTAIWDSNFDTPTTVALFRELSAKILRFPGGSLSDQYHWGSNKTGDNTWTWATSFANFVHVATNIGAQAFITVNYGSGTPGEAAAWVRHSNVTNHYAFKYWEIGNECYGTWETDTNNKPNDAYTYALRATNYIAQMKAADPTIKIGIVVAPGEESYANGNTSHAATNSRNGQLHYGWTPVLLSTLKSLGVTPDFAIHHRYPQYTPNSSVVADSDALALQSTSGWVAEAAELRQEIADYFGSGGTNIELVCTENNADAGAQGRQSTSLVNGLYYAESLGQLMKTEFNSFVWWDFRNGTDTTGNFDPTLYGWRNNGDLGMVGNLSTKYPAYYAAKLMSYFASEGDSVLNAATDYPLLQGYATRQGNGALSVLVASRDTVTNLHAQIVLNNFTPGSTALLRSFGIPQDEAARTNGPVAAQDLATNTFAVSTNFTYDFPPLSLTLFRFVPTAPRLSLISAHPEVSGEVVLQLQSQPDINYVIQSSTNLSTWTPISTNRLTTATQILTNFVPSDSPLLFFRAVWIP